MWKNLIQHRFRIGESFCNIILEYIKISIVNNNVAAEITRLQKNMVVLEVLAPSENLASNCPSENSAHPL